jgi:virginiamycin B lyase
MPGTTSQLSANAPLAYIETTIPSGTTIGEYRCSRPRRRSRWHWLRHLSGRRRWAGLPGAVAISVGAIVVLLLVFVGSAEAHVYWTNNAAATIGRANLDGTGVNQGLVSGGFNPCGVAVDGAHVYWGNIGAGTIGRASLDGSGANQSFVGGQVGPCGVAVDGAHVYWADTNGAAIGRANLDGSGASEIVAGIDAPCGVAVDGAHVYWGSVAAGTIGRANLDGSRANPGFIGGATGPCGVAVDGAHVYWSNGLAGTIGRANLDGTGVNQSLISGGFNSCGVALDGAHVYWTNADAGTIGRANLDGTGVNQSLIGGATMPCGVAVDADPTGGGQDPGGGGGVITNPPPPIAGGGGVITDPPAPVDTAAQLPTLGRIRVVRRQRRLVARVPLFCPSGETGGCRTALRLATAKRVVRAGVLARVVLGAKRVSLRPGQRLTVRIRLARRAAGFARHGRLATRIRIKSSDAAGNSATRSLTRRLRTPPR